jgi:hypothetical protein
MSTPLPAQADAAEWAEHLQSLSDRAERMLKAKNGNINDHAALAVDALKVLWSGWSPELIYASCQASLAVGTPVVSGRPVAQQLVEIEEHLQDFYEQSQQQPVAPDPVSLMPVQMMVPPGTYQRPEPKKAGRRPRQQPEPEGEPDPVIEPDPDPVVLVELEPVAAELPDLWEQQDERAAPVIDNANSSRATNAAGGGFPPPADPLPVTVHQADEQADAEPVALWPEPEPAPAPVADPELAITVADLPETITAVQVASWWGISVSQVFALSHRRGVLQRNIHWRKHRRPEPKGNRYYVAPTFAAISAATGKPIPEHPLQTVEQALQPRRPGRRERRLLAEKVLAELATVG